MSNSLLWSLRNTISIDLCLYELNWVFLLICINLIIRPSKRTSQQDNIVTNISCIHLFPYLRWLCSLISKLESQKWNCWIIGYEHFEDSWCILLQIILSTLCNSEYYNENFDRNRLRDLRETYSSLCFWVAITGTGLLWRKKLKARRSAKN